MHISILNYITEAALWILLWGLTFSNSASEIAIGIIIGAFIVKKLFLKEFSLPRTPINTMAYILCAIVFVSFLRSAYFSESIRGLLRIIKYVLLYFSLVEFFIADEKRIRRTFWVLMAIAGFTFLNGIFQSIYKFDLLRHREVNMLDCYSRICASFVHPNDFGAYIIFILPMTFCFFYPGLKKKEKIFLVINCLLGVYCLLKTSSRAAWLGFLVGVILYFFIYKKNISVIVPFGILLLFIVSPYGFERIRSLFTLEQNTVWERAQLWKGTWNMIKVHPFLGFGINTFSRYFLEYKPSVYPDIRYTHNSYLQMWSEIGIMGLVAFVSIIFTILKNVLKDIKNKLRKGLEGLILLGLVSGYVAFLVQSGLDTNLYSLVLTTFFWVMNAYIISINKTLDNRKEQ